MQYSRNLISHAAKDYDIYEAIVLDIYQKCETIEEFYSELEKCVEERRIYLDTRAGLE